ncbi:Chorismate mutase [Azospirillaceae bacterium]
MSPNSSNLADSSHLEALRNEIDRIDDALHDLLMERTLIVEQIGAIKNRDRTLLRPDREALILRRLVARHSGHFPLGVLVRMWREMISGLTRLQGPFAVAVFAPEERRGFWDVARDHFGSGAPMTAVNSTMAVLRAVTEGAAQVGVVPYPADDDTDPWWRFLAGSDSRTPHIVARLPFGARGNSRGDARDALAVALLPQAPTGDDRTMIRIEMDCDLSRGRLKDAIEAVNLFPAHFCSWDMGAAGGSLHLVEITDFVSTQDERLVRLAARLGDHLIRINTIGGYAAPLALSPDFKK